MSNSSTTFGGVFHAGTVHLSSLDPRRFYCSLYGLRFFFHHFSQIASTAKSWLPGIFYWKWACCRAALKQRRRRDGEHGSCYGLSGIACGMNIFTIYQPSCPSSRVCPCLFPIPCVHTGCESLLSVCVEEAGFPSPPSSWFWPPFAHLHTAQPRASHAHPCPNNSENQKSGWNHS